MKVEIVEGYEPVIGIALVMYLVLAILFINIARKEKGKYKKIALFISAAFFIIAPILMLLGNVFGNIGVIIFGFITPLGLSLGTLSIELLVRYYRCNTVVSGQYCGMELVSSYRGNKTYAPEFSYSFEGKRYKKRSFLNYSYKQINKRYVKNNEYELYINPKYPENVVIKNVFSMNVFIITLMFMLSFTSLLFVCFGIFALIAG